MEDSISRIVLSLVWTPIVRQIQYPFKAKANVARVKKAADKLKITVGEVKQKMDAAATSSEVVPTERVQKWLKDAAAAVDKAAKIEQKYEQRQRCLGGCLLNGWSGYKLSKQAARVSVAITELIVDEEKNLGEVTRRIVPAIKRLPTMPGQQSTKLNLQAAIDCLQDDKVGMIAIWGMGGVGKTQLLKRINNLPYLEAAGFDHVIWVVASQDLDINKLQKEIAQRVGLHLKADMTLKEQRESIYRFLKFKKFLLLLDDIWEPFDLEELGIPCPNTSSGSNANSSINNTAEQLRKVMFTTRSEAVCDQMMACQKYLIDGSKIKVECMEQDKAWQLFLDNVGEAARTIISSDDRVLLRARKIADKCGGLPLALIVIGHAMSSNKTLHEWAHALDSLETMELREMWSKRTDPFPLLKVSYDRLPDDAMKNCFLCCAQWPEDWDIGEEQLIERCLGLNLIGNFKDMNAAYNKGCTIIQRLKQACLLEEGVTSIKTVKMHDMIRGMALWIASDLGANKNRWVVKSGVQSKQQMEDIILAWQEAEIISWYRSSTQVVPYRYDCPNLTALFLPFFKKAPDMPDDLFCNMTALKCLEIGSFESRMKLPSSIGCLARLHHLKLNHVHLTSLPIELSKLRELRYLYLWRIKLDSIPNGLLSNLEKLEVLHIYDYHGWGREGEASLDELGCSRFGLKALGIHVITLSMMQQISRNSRVTLVRIRLERLAGVTTLQLLKAILYNGNHRHSLQQMEIDGCGDLEEMHMAGQCEEEFENLHIFRLKECPKLERITWTGVTPGVLLRNVTTLSLRKCQRLKNVTWIGQLCYLERLSLFDCAEMEQAIGDAVVGSEAGGQRRTPIFCNLKFLWLKGLPKLLSFSSQGTEFGSLKRIIIADCPLLDESPFVNHKIERNN